MAVLPSEEQTRAQTLESPSEDRNQNPLGCLGGGVSPGREAVQARQGLLRDSALWEHSQASLDVVWGELICEPRVSGLKLQDCFKSPEHLLCWAQISGLWSWCDLEVSSAAFLGSGVLISASVGHK